jgi:hypothetical protein
LAAISAASCFTFRNKAA